MSQRHIKPDPLASFASRLKVARVAAGLSQKKLAPKAGCSRTLLVTLEQGKTKDVSANLIFRLADALGVSPRWLATGGGTQTGTKGLSNEEKALILVYRGLPKPLQDHLTQTAESLALAATVAPSKLAPLMVKRPIVSGE